MADMDEEAEDRLVTSLMRVVVPVLAKFGLRPPDLTTEELAELAASLMFCETAGAERIALAASDRHLDALEAAFRAALEKTKES
jgi:hypothetical protein